MWSLIPSRSARRAAPIRPSRTLFFCLVGAFLLTILPHAEQLPVWVVIVVLIAMLVRSVAEVRRWPLPSPMFSGALALCVLAAIYIQFGTILGRDAGTAFMISLLTLKFFELRNARDIALIIFCSFFVVMSSLLYSQDLELFTYCLIMMWVLTALLLRTSMGDLAENRLFRLLGTSALFFAQALPLTLFLFFLFPRYHGVLQLGSDVSSIGLTDKVEPGSISRLAEDDSTAMMVKLTGSSLLNASTMYWRALVLWNYDNGAWTSGLAGISGKKEAPALPTPAPGGTIVTQEITIYPHFHRWLFALDYPVSRAESSDGAPEWSEALNGGVLRLKNSGDVISRKEHYVVNSATLLGPQALPDFLRTAALQLPSGPGTMSPKVTALAEKLQQGCRSTDDYVRAVLHYFRHEGFVYSDAPGPRGKDALEDFLFVHRTGFCEHYASAFAVLMRLGHVPARVIAGYQGAQFNPYNSLYVVKQSNAHSWDEVWIDAEKTWRRVDPTAILSGRETLTGIRDPARDASAENISIEVANHHYTLISGSSLPLWVRRTLMESQWRRQEFEADWNDFVFSYDPEAQGRLAAILGFHYKARTILGLASMVVVTVFGVILGLFMRRRARVSPVEKFYANFCRGMAHRGAPREDWEGPLAYTQRVAAAFPDQRREIGQAGELVMQARYSGVPPAVTRSELKSLLRSLTPTRSPVSTSHDN